MHTAQAKIYFRCSHHLSCSSINFYVCRFFSCTSDKKGVSISKFIPGHFLRLNDESNFDPSTYQRVDVLFDRENGKPLAKTEFNLPKTSLTNGNVMDFDNAFYKSTRTDDRCEIQWSDGHVSFFNSQWIDTQIKKRRQTPRRGKNDDTCANLNLPLIAHNDISTEIPRLPWSDLSEKDIRSRTQYHKMRFDFKDIVNKDESISRKAVQSLFQYGIIFVTSTPTSDNGAGVAALSSALTGPANKLSPETTLMAHYLDCNDIQNNQSRRHPSTILERGTDGPQRTMYGNVWYTNASSMVDGTSTADSSYGSEALPLHTDFTYFRDPPGLQIFTMVSPADKGGESVFADGLAIAEYMRTNHYSEFDTLCRVRRRYRSIDKEHGWYLEGSGPVIEAIDMWEGLAEIPNDGKIGRWGPVVGIRHNDLDRLPDLPPPINSNENEEDHAQQHTFDEKFYQDLNQAHKVWDNLLGSDRFRLAVGMKAGDTAVVANQRCLHGRFAFSLNLTPRSVMGCYVSQDDVESRIRWMLEGNCRFK